MSLPLVSNNQIPDHNWSQIRETIAMFYLSAAQIESSMQEGSESIHRLTAAFTNISNASSKIDAIANLQVDTNQHANPHPSTIKEGLEIDNHNINKPASVDENDDDIELF